jgi:hypothetical protein
MDGAVLVHDRYQNYDAFPGLSHQLCCAHYPEWAVMPMGKRFSLAAAVPGLAVSA